MKAAHVVKYDKNNIGLFIKEAPKPRMKNGQALLSVLAAGVNPLDVMISRGEVKLIVPYSLPLIGGNEVVGVIESVSASNNRFKVGDRVFARLPLGDIGAFAEYVAVDIDALALVPEYLSDAEAAAVPLTALTVMQSLDIMDPQPGETIFISGGTGGVGAMAIPIAKTKGLTVVTNGAGDSKERVLNLGADRFLDYKTENYVDTLSKIDYALDTLGGDETEKQMGILRPGGHIVSLRAMPNVAFAKRMQFPWWKQVIFTFAGQRFDRMAKRYGVKYDFIFVESNGEKLQQVAKILDDIRLKPSIDAVFNFSEINQALDKVSNGRSRGKTVVTIPETT